MVMQSDARCKRSAHLRALGNECIDAALPRVVLFLQHRRSRGSIVRGGRGRALL